MPLQLRTGRFMLAISALALGLAGSELAAQAIGTAFTYQGRIALTGNAVNGPIDFEFQVYDTGGAAVGGPITRADVVCTDGLFTTSLDFGPGVFAGARRFLEIRVSPNFPGTPYTVLTPRQELVPSPYALFAPNAGFATDAGNLGGVPPSGYALTGHTHAASTITGVTAPAVVFGQGGGLAGDAVNFSYDSAAHDLNLTGVYRIGGGAVMRVAPALDNTFAGLSGNATVTGSGNTALGEAALAAANGVDQNTAVGFRALSANIADPLNVNGLFGDFNTAVGNRALEANTTGFANTALGTSALGANLTGFVNTAVGAGALAANTASANTALGSSALNRNTSGSDNTAVGSNALATNLTGGRNTAVGIAALNANTASDNSALGALALQKNTSGAQNTAMGASALLENLGGGSNTAFGAYALDANQAGNNNTAIGSQALGAATSSNNTAVGSGALDAVTIGAANIGIGLDAGGQINTGSGNIMIGGGILPTAGSNNIIIGHPGTVGDNAMIRLGTTGTHVDTRIAGISGTAIAGPTQAVLVNGNGQLGTAVASSRELKEDIHDMGARAERLLGLRPVVFRYREDVAPGAGERPLQYGLIAEEVAAIEPDWVVRDSQGKVAGVRYDQINAALLGLAQRQQAQIEQLQAQTQALAERLARIESQGLR